MSFIINIDEIWSVILFSIIRKIDYTKKNLIFACYWFTIVYKIFKIFETVYYLRLFAFSLLIILQNILLMYLTTLK